MALQPPPFRTPFLAKDGLVEPNVWQRWLLDQSMQTGASAPDNARYVTTTSNVDLTNEFNLGALTTGYLKLTVAAGIGTPSTTTTLNSSDLTGALPAISGAALTSLTGANVTHSVVVKTFVDTGYVALVDQTVLADASGGALTIKLPGTATSGTRVIVKKTDASANVVTVDGNAHGIDGAASKALAAQYKAYVVEGDGSDWFIIAAV